MASTRNRMRRHLKILSGLILLCLLLAIAGAAAYLRSSLPQLDGDVRAPTLGAPMTVERDAFGVPTISARDRFDAAYGIGYLHAQDRFFQMDMLRRSGAGELSELFGPIALNVDRAHRLFRFRALAAAVVAHLPPDDLRLLQRYTQGVNDGLAALRARPFEYALLRMQPQPWRPEDSMLVIWAMYFDLQGRLASREFARHWLQAHSTPEQLAFLLPSSSRFDAPLDAPGVAAPVARVSAAAPAWLREAGPTAPIDSVSLDERSSVGSNNWVLAGSRSVRGAAIVGDDMHLSLGLPNIWYRAAFTSSGGASPATRVVGVTLPGLPAVVVGSNGRIAWGFTNGYADCLDLMPLERDAQDPRRFRLGDGWQTARASIETIRVHGAAPVDLTVLETTAGPVRDIGGKFYAAHWIAQSSGAANLEFVRMTDAAGIEDAIRIANAAGLPAQNIVIGDSTGRIGWTIAGALPDRRSRPANGASSWQAALPPDAYPRIVDPAGGQLWTANNRQLASDAYRLIGDGGADLGARASQLRDGLTALGRTDERSAYRLDLDDRARFMSLWRDRALRVLDDAALAGHPARAEFRRLLVNGWTGRASVDSVGYTLARGYLHRLYDVIFGSLDARLKRQQPDADYALANPRWPVVIARLLDAQPAAWLPPDASSWRDVQLTAIDRTIAALTGKGAPLADATWGDRNTLRIAHPFARSVPLVGRWLSAPADQVPGDANMPRVAGPKFGQSERIVVSPGHEEDGLFNMPGGQSGHPLSPFFLAGHEAWVKGEPMPFLPGPTEHTLRFAP
ncbi:penicillin acylase family protein [Burkholderia oklahomensis]|uniref:Penicillin amidase family protein n=1 Tax=Burkholderia oklahomensis TaxID=342113 RepID=A0AAI8FNB1_9BURK|nr:penicillin acylase family protein [Burkholderia oklahomensis]AIO66919.1 penicillin amidase family protein [Burkholderia oklahomensis]AJX32139.1 penicillin amidase family protein [Burkholderia oklahomensis C6786]AOI43430.1 penicillin amidase [Burkholderia oklahomensis EO147]AOI46999.1 penicillin amidase [Burkholderia oklahomensis C6786]KUY54054.1 penicillin amidase [Burkholderia oklahomensis EO147]